MRASALPTAPCEHQADFRPFVGGYELDQAQLTNGAILANTVHFEQGTAFTWDPDSGVAGGTGYGNFDLIRAWEGSIEHCPHVLSPLRYTER
jgi:hypothetical protein